MKPVILVGHRHVCPLHGSNQVESGSSAYTFNGRPVARVGDRTTCGAVIISGAANFLIEGAAVARKGIEPTTVACWKGAMRAGCWIDADGLPGDLWQPNHRAACFAGEPAPTPTVLAC